MINAKNILPIDRPISLFLRRITANKQLVKEPKNQFSRAYSE